MQRISRSRVGLFEGSWTGRVSWVFPIALVIGLAGCVSPERDDVASQAHEQYVETLYPNGVDDTEALQGAFDQCAAAPGRCRIQLAEGVFKTLPLVADGFAGAIRGAGADRTIIQARTDVVLHVTDVAPFDADDPTAEEPWPALITFLDSSVAISDLTVEVPAGTRIDGWWPVCAGGTEPFMTLAAAIWVASRDLIDFTTRDLIVRGALDADADWGIVPIHNIIVGGWLLPEDYADECNDNITPSGALVMQRTTLETAVVGLSAWNMLDSRVQFTHNVVRGTLAAFSMTDVSGSMWIAHNQLAASIEIILEDATSFGMPSFDNTRVHILDNQIDIGDFGFAGIYYEEWGAPEGNTLKAHLNDIHMGEGSGYGALVVAAQDAKLAMNSISGTPEIGIFSIENSGLTLSRNDFGDLDPSWVDIYLNQGSEDCKVVAHTGDEVIDDGTGNTVIFH